MTYENGQRPVLRKYIGTKIVQAEPAQSWKRAGEYPAGSDGYRVVYEDGYESWSPKDVFEEAYREYDDQVTEIARAAHEVNRAYCASQGDFSQAPWDEAPEWQKRSAINGVNFHLENPDADPEASHNNWLAEKSAAGWVYGQEKNEELKTHPCMRPYKDLPPDQRAKDHIFRAVVKSLLG